MTSTLADPIQENSRAGRSRMAPDLFTAGAASHPDELNHDDASATTGGARAQGLSAFGAVLNLVPAVLGRVSVAGFILEAEGAGLSGRGLTPAALRHARFTRLFPEGRAALVQALGGEHACFEVGRPAEEGSEWNLRVHLCFDANSGRGAVFFAQEITPQRRLERQLLHAVEAERQRLGADLHDEVGQLLTGITCLGTALVERLRGRDDLAAEEAGTITEVAREALEQTRALSRALAPVRLARHGLAGALAGLREHVRRVHDAELRLHLAETANVFDSETTTHLFRIAQECVSNALRHGGARVIELSLTRTGRTWRLAIADDGCGFDPDQARNAAGSGLGLMEHRASLLGGHLRIFTRCRAGTRIELTFTPSPSYSHENAC